MGNLLAYCFQSDSILDKEEVAESKPVYSWDTRGHVDPADYGFDDLVGETRGKGPGTIAGQQFSIENCKDCILFVLDNVASVTIDDCTNCVIFIGPSKGSVFIRDSADVKLGVACQQFRSRDCKRVDTYLHCNTQPIIESSTDMRFACLQINYPQLNGQVEAAGISLFNNEWSNIYDFSPVEHCSNFSLLPQNSRFDKHLTTSHISSVLPYNEISSDGSVFPLTVGNSLQGHFEDSVLLAVFMGPNGANDDVHSLIAHVQSKDCQLRRSKDVKMNTDTVKRIFLGSERCGDFIKAAKEGMVIGFEVEGDLDALRSDLPTSDSILLHLSGDETSGKEINSFFNYVDMMMST